MISILLKDKNNLVSLYSYVTENGTNYFEKYFDELTEIEQTKFTNLFDKFLEQGGKLFNKEQYRDLGDEIYEFKIFGHRAFNFHFPKVTPKMVIITHACPKKRNDSLPKKDIGKAKQIRGIIIEAKNKNNLQIINRDK